MSFTLCMQVPNHQNDHSVRHLSVRFGGGRREPAGGYAPTGNRSLGCVAKTF